MAADDPLTPELSISKATVGITIGDAAGIGPEIVLKALGDDHIRSSIRPIIIGDERFLRRTASSLGIDIEFCAFPESATGAIEIVDLANLPRDVTPGQENADTGRAAGQYIEKAVELWREGKLSAIATAPISKSSLAAGGYAFPGHTEFLAALTGTTRFAMSFFAEKLRVVLVSTHLPLTEAIRAVTQEKLTDVISFADMQLGRLLSKKIKIAVAGLNPHASEGGMFGSEEADTIMPAIEHCRVSLGIDVSGPFSPDT